MKALLPAAVLSVAMSADAFALSGGPEYPVAPDTPNQSGTYQLVFRARNFMGLVNFGVSGSSSSEGDQLTTAGFAAAFYQGMVSDGFVYGQGGPASGQVDGLFEIGRIRQGIITQTITTDTEAIVYTIYDFLYGTGTFHADLDLTKIFSPATGSGTIFFSYVDGLDRVPIDPKVVTDKIKFSVYGARTSTSTTSFSGLSTPVQPSVSTQAFPK